MKKIICIVLLFTGIYSGYAQNDIDRLLYRANGYFDVENYKAALPLFIEAIEKGEKAPVFLYRAGNLLYDATRSCGSSKVSSLF